MGAGKWEGSSGRFHNLCPFYTVLIFQKDVTPLPNENKVLLQKNIS